MAMFSAYFDASGHPGQGGALTVAGYVSRVAKWKRFDVGWKAILDRENVSQFHMTDFASSFGEYCEWRGQTERRKTFTADLFQCIKKNTNKAFRTTVILADYIKADRQWCLKESIGTPYALCSCICLHHLELWAGKRDAINNVLCFFEDGDKDKGDFQARAYFYSTICPEFLSKKNCSAFQAADLAGWKARIATQNAVRNPSDPNGGKNRLRSVQQMRGVPSRGSAGIFDYDELVKFCITREVPRR